MKKQLHVGLVLLNLPLDKSCGSCRHVGDLATALVKKGIRVTVFASRSKDQKHVSTLKGRRIHIREIDFPNLGSWKNFVDPKNSRFVNKGIFDCINSIILENRRNPINVLNVQHIVGSSIVGVVIKHFLGIPFITTCHGSDIYELSDIKYKKMFSLVNEGDGLLCVSNDVYKSILSINKNIRNVKKSVVVTLGVNKDVFCYSNRQRKRQVIFAGRLMKEKGVEEAIKVFLKATNIGKLSNYKLVIAGDGVLKTILKKKYYSYIKNKKITFLDTLSQKELARTMGESKVLLFTSTWNEPFGMVLTEAIATGTPVLANDVGRVKEIVSKNSGIVISRNDWTSFAIELRALLLDYVKWNYLSRGAKVTSEHYNWDRMAKGIIKVYESTIN